MEKDSQARLCSPTAQTDPADIEQETISIAERVQEDCSFLETRQEKDHQSHALDQRTNDCENIEQSPKDCDDLLFASISLTSRSDFFEYESIDETEEKPGESEIRNIFSGFTKQTEENVAQNDKHKIAFFIENLLKDLGGGLPLSGMLFKILVSESRSNKEISEILKLDDDVVFQDICNSLAILLKYGGSKVKILEKFVEYLIKLQNSGLRSMGKSIFKNITDLNLILLFVYYFLIFHLIPTAVPEEALTVGFSDYESMAKHVVNFIIGLRSSKKSTVQVGNTKLEGEFGHEDLCAMILVLRRVHDIDKRYPLMHSTLGLGSSWEKAVFDCIREFL